MTRGKSNPPRLALWLLRHRSPDDHDEALTGDLVERFREGQSRSWLWRQVFFACAYSVFGAIRLRWSFFCYAIAGTAAMNTFSPHHSLGLVSEWLHWSDLPWPWSQLIFELSSPAIVALASLSILAIGLRIAHSLHWLYLLRTWIASFVLIAISQYSIDMFPWLLRSIPGDPYHKVLIVPQVVQVLFLASTFLVAAWLGCPIVKPAHKSESQPVGPKNAASD